MMGRRVRAAGWGVPAALMALAAARPAWAQVDETGLDTGNTAWMLAATALVLMMTIPGLALFYGGMVRKRNVLATLMQSFSICCLVTVLWMVAGYSLAFAPGNDWIGGLDRVMLRGMEVGALTGTIPESLFMVFQMTFAIITPALITGAFADRMKFSAMLLFMGAWLLLVYAPVAHWVWGGGFLATAGVLDFAGGTVVHVNAGIAGLVAALVVGKRNGHGGDSLAPHNLVLTVLGGSLLWVGWFGFNAGSALAANGAAGMALAVTQIASAAAALSWMAVEWAMRKKPSVLGIVSGAVAGLVAITPAAGFVTPSGALLIGFAAGAACWFGATTLKRLIGCDDALDVFGVHGVGGIVGALLTGVFAAEAIGGKPGLLQGNPAQLWAQAYGLFITMAYGAAVSFANLTAIAWTVGLRVGEEVERDGLDLALHGETVG
jgi:ammonium transporter, Amt family